MKIAILFGHSGVSGKIAAVNGTLKKAAENTFKLPQGGRLEVEFKDFTLKRGAFPTIVNVVTEKDPFSFFLRDVNSESPIYIPEFKVAVIPADDLRTFFQVADAVVSRSLLSEFGRFENEPEETYENSCQYNLDQHCETWLGLGRDIRMFRVGCQDINSPPGRDFKYLGRIAPVYHSQNQTFGKKLTPYSILFEIGPGTHCRTKVTRRLECGVLPIIRAVQDEAEIQYHVTSFVSLEKNLLDEKNVRGTDWQAAYANCGSNALKPEEREEIKDLLDFEMHRREQETVCALRTEAVNTGKTPNYAYFKAPHLAAFGPCSDNPKFENGKTFSTETNRIFAVALIDGQPMPDEEMAILVQPSQKVVFDILVPHSPLTEKRAEKLFMWNIEKHLEACRNFWLKKLDAAAMIKVPETAIDERIKAGLLHCDINTIGPAQEGPLLPTVGWYAPIGTESAPMIQFYDSMGLHQTAERCLDFFLVRQKENGYIQNYSNYQSETGPLLWTAGEHFRYTHDLGWLKKVLPKLKKAADYLLVWRERNKRPELKATGCYGLIDGKVADPEDFYHAYFLNAGTYIGLARVAELSAELEPAYAKKLQKEVDAYRQDIVNSIYYSQAKAPVIPLGDGSWAPLLPSWAEGIGGNHLYADGANTFTHGTFVARVAMIGANWLIFQEALDADEPAADFIVKTNQTMTRENAAFSQPYYSRHDFAHIKRGEVKAFLKAYYNQFTGLQDRETYTFWEHFWHASEHKTHEEAWFLMQTRWMLYLEEGNTLFLLKAIPRRWLGNGKKIILDGVASYFGPIDFRAHSNLDTGIITAAIVIKSDRLPTVVTIRLPHPEGLKAIACDGGIYDPPTETVTINNFTGKATVTVRF